MLSLNLIFKMKNHAIAKSVEPLNVNQDIINLLALLLKDNKAGDLLFIRFMRNRVWHFDSIKTFTCLIRFELNLKSVFNSYFYV